MKKIILLGILGLAANAVAMEISYDPQEKLFELCKGKFRSQCVQEGIDEHIVAEELIKQGASVSARDKGYETPLHHVARVDAFGVADVLLENGADPKVRNIQDENPLHIAVRYKSKLFIKMTRIPQAFKPGDEWSSV